MMARYRKKPVEIDAVQLRWDTWGEMCDHAGVGKLEDGKPQGTYVNAKGEAVDPPDLGDVPGALGLAKMDAEGYRMGLLIPTLEGLMIGVEGDWIIRGVKGELYPCKPDIFDATYEPAGGQGRSENE
jgi:hypothetical protein